MIELLHRWIARIYQVLKISIILLKKWPLPVWIKFWITIKPETLVQINDVKLFVRTKNIFTKTTDISMVYECILRDDYQLRNLNPPKESVIIDIGAHIGSFSIMASKKFSQSNILSFEPSPDNYSLLKKNVRIDKLENITIFNKAVTSHTQGIKIHINPLNSALNTMYGNIGKSIKIPSTTLKEIFTKNKINKCYFLKMDCEGAEYDIILNTPINILKKINKMVIEYHNPEYFGIKEKNYNLKNLIQHLKNSGFTCKINKVKSYQGVITATH